jgi:hypothetical protein
MSCYFGRYEKQTQIRINGFYSDCELNLKLDEKVYDLVCVLIDLEEKLEEIVNV